jgi:multiple sugar transport system substrate-binding protein
MNWTSTSGNRAALRCCARMVALLLAAGAAGCGLDDPQPVKPESINLMIWNPARIKGPILSRVPLFERKTGINVAPIEVADLGAIFEASQSADHDVDVAIGLNVWVGDFVNSGFVEPLDEYIKADRAAGDPELSWETIPEGVVNKNTWGGRTYSMICDNDNMILIYRKDVLGDQANKDAFLAEYKYPLPSPPTTVDELIDVARFFDNKDWDGDGVPERGFVTSRKSPNELMYWYALSVTTPYTVMPREVVEAMTPPLPRGLFMFKPDMTPLVNTPGFKTGIAKWLALARLASPMAGRQDVIDQLVGGEALMAIDWGDTGPASVDPKSKARGKLGFALPPGTRSYYDWVKGAMVDTPGVHYAPLHQANGFAFFMTSTSKHKQAVWKFIKYMNSPEVSMDIVSDPGGGYQPWRTSHTEVDKWVKAGWEEADAANYVDAILKSLNHPNASLDLRIPGIFAYGAALENHLVKLLAAPNPNVDAEMDACAAEMNAVTSANQIESQRAAYRAHLGLPQ